MVMRWRRRREADIDCGSDDDNDYNDCGDDNLVTVIKLIV